MYIFNLTYGPPSLFSVAKPIDGVDQWNTVSRGWPSARSEFVYNINEVTGSAAIRYIS